jgi:hypothetical protein
LPNTLCITNENGHRTWRLKVMRYFSHHSNLLSFRSEFWNLLEQTFSLCVWRVVANVGKRTLSFSFRV